jgi:epoxyqueuosine reductase QueG
LRLSETSQPPLRPEYAPRPPAPALPLLDVLNWSATDRQQAFTRSALKRIKLEMLKRNALIAAGNHLRKHDQPALRRRIEQLAADANESPLVRDTAQQVLDALKRPQPLNPNPQPTTPNP